MGAVLGAFCIVPFGAAGDVLFGQLGGTPFATGLVPVASEETPLPVVEEVVVVPLLTVDVVLVPFDVPFTVVCAFGTVEFGLVAVGLVVVAALRQFWVVFVVVFVVLFVFFVLLVVGGLVVVVV